MTDRYDVLVVGAGTAGIPAAIEAGARGARVLLVEKDVRVGGTLHTTGGQMSGAGTRLQTRRGVTDSVDLHLADIARVTGGAHRADLVTAAVTHAAATLDWLEEHGFEPDPASPKIVPGHEPYSVPRTVQGVDAGRSILAVLEPLLAEQVAAGTVDVRTGTAAVALLPDPHDPRQVRGATLRRDGEDDVLADHVVLASGGFAADPDLFAELEGVPLVSAAQPTSTGDGLRMARRLGAAVQGTDGGYVPTFGGLPHPTEPGRVRWADRPVLATAARLPWEIYVDRTGRRWLREDEPSIEVKQRTLVERLPDLTYFVVLDDAALDASHPLVAGWTPDDLRAHANARAGVHAADTITGLAATTGIDPDGLVATVERYNRYVDAGRDDELGRRHLPAPIARPPFYALRNHGIALLSFAGLDCDAELRVRREDGTSFRNLYGVGEVLGGRATNGGAYASGMTLTPALTFGRLVGARLGELVAATA